MKLNASPFKWRHYALNVILLRVRRRCRYQLFHSSVEEMPSEHGLTVRRSTIFHSVQHYFPKGTYEYELALR